MEIMTTRKLLSVALGIFFLATLASPLEAQNRLKELVTIEGFRSNKLVGYGIVVGLSGTGDNASSPVVRRSLSKVLQRLGITIAPSEIKAKNVAAVLVTGDLPAFARPGMSINVTVSSISTAKSLQGGTLIATPLKGADLEPYAIAQGPISLGGFAVSGLSGSSKAKNHPTVARIPDGAIIERGAPNRLTKGRVTLLLKEPDFTTAARIASAIDERFQKTMALVRDPGAVTVVLNAEWRKRPVQFIAELEAIEAVADSPARVIIDERTGTVVVGQNVRLGPAAIAHGALVVEIREQEVPSQPGILSEGETTTTQETKIEVYEEPGNLKPIGPATTVGEVAGALNALGAKPRDLVSIFQSLRAAGALRAEIRLQ